MHDLFPAPGSLVARFAGAWGRRLRERSIVPTDGAPTFGPARSPQHPRDTKPRTADGLRPPRWLPACGRDRLALPVRPAHATAPVAVPASTPVDRECAAAAGANAEASRRAGLLPPGGNNGRTPQVHRLRVAHGASRARSQPRNPGDSRRITIPPTGGWTSADSSRFPADPALSGGGLARLPSAPGRPSRSRSNPSPACVSAGGSPTQSRSFQPVEMIPTAWRGVPFAAAQPGPHVGLAAHRTLPSLHACNGPPGGCRTLPPGGRRCPSAPPPFAERRA